MASNDHQAWLDSYARAWEARDPDAAAALFAEDALYQRTPFDEPMRGRDAIRAYWTRATADQDHVKCACEQLGPTSDGCVARWRTSLVVNGSWAKVAYDGIFLLSFDNDGSCTSLLEWWHTHENW